MKYLIYALTWGVFLIVAVFMGAFMAWGAGLYAATLGYPSWVGGIAGTVIAYFAVMWLIRFIHRKAVQ